MSEQYQQKVELTYTVDDESAETLNVQLSFDPAVPGRDSGQRENMDLMQCRLQDIVQDQINFLMAAIKRDFGESLARLCALHIEDEEDAREMIDELDNASHKILNYLETEGGSIQ